MKRVERNLAQIRKSSQAGKAFEVTQLLSSFLLTLLYTWDDLCGSEDVKDHTWPTIKGLDWANPNDTLRFMRNALAHGNIAFDGKEKIELIHFWNCPMGNQPKFVNWEASLTPQDLGDLLSVFCDFANGRDGALAPRKQKGDPCT